MTASETSFLADFAHSAGKVETSAEGDFILKDVCGIIPVVKECSIRNFAQQGRCSLRILKFVSKSCLILPL